MITIHWSLLIYAGVIAFGLYLLFQESDAMGFNNLCGLVVIALATAIYGGIFWW